MEKTEEKDQLHRVFVMGEIAFTYRTVELEEIQPYTEENKKTFYVAVCKTATVKPRTVNFKKMDTRLLSQYAEKILQRSGIAVFSGEDDDRITLELAQKSKRFTPEKKKAIIKFLAIQLFIFAFVFGCSFLLGWIDSLL